MSDDLARRPARASRARLRAMARQLAHQWREDYPEARDDFRDMVASTARLADPDREYLMEIHVPTEEARPWNDTR